MRIVTINNEKLYKKHILGKPSKKDCYMIKKKESL